MPHKTWIVVANRSAARLFSRASADAPFELFASLENPAARLERGEIAHEHLTVEFARRLALLLGLARANGRCRRIVLVAEPRFLGALRRSLDAQTKALITRTITKDWIPLDARAVERRVQELIAPVSAEPAA